MNRMHRNHTGYKLSDEVKNLPLPYGKHRKSVYGYIIMKPCKICRTRTPWWLCLLVPL